MSFSVINLVKKMTIFHRLGITLTGSSSGGVNASLRLGAFPLARSYHVTSQNLSTTQPTKLGVDKLTTDVVDTSHAFFESLLRDDDADQNHADMTQATPRKFSATNAKILIHIGGSTTKAKEVERFLMMHNSKTMTWSKVYGHCKVEYSTGEVYEGSVVNGLRDGPGRCIYPDKSIKTQKQSEIIDSGSGSVDTLNGLSHTISSSPSATTMTTPSTSNLATASKPLAMSTPTRFYTYDGMYHKDYRHGQGTMNYPNGDIYKGIWKRDKRNGSGTLTSATGESVTGVFQDDKLHSGKGSIVRKDGEICTGTWVNGSMNGYGTTIYPDGTTYTGEFVDNYPHGTGRMVLKSGEVYEGHFVRRKRHGEGVLRYANGDKYEGNFEQGKRHGQGTHISGAKSEHTFVGEFRNGLLYSGAGKVMMTGDALFEGEWKGGVFHGRYSDSRGSNVTGEFRNNRVWSGQGILIEEEVTYEGTWVEGKRTGPGKLTVVGQKLVGEFQNDSIYTGEGVMIYPDCSSYVGKWIKGKRQGPGVFTNVMGQILAGRFKNDAIYTGNGVFVLPTGVVYDGAWLEGHMCGHAVFTDINGTVTQGEVRGDSIYRGISTFKIGNAVLTHVITHGKRCGEWRIAYADGTTRQGISAGELHNTHSSVLQPNGDIHEGYFVDGKLHGQGKITNISQQVLEGEFRNGRLYQGQGVLKHANGAVYDGIFAEGKRHGQGTFTCPSGYIVTGEFKENKLFTGSGTRLMLSEDLYESSWVKGKFHGVGKITHKERWFDSRG